LNASISYENVTIHSTQLSVPDYMAPTISSQPGLPDIDQVLDEVDRILQGKGPEQEPQPSRSNRVVIPHQATSPLVFTPQSEDAIRNFESGELTEPIYGYAQTLRFFQVYGSDSRLVVLVDYLEDVVEEDDDRAAYQSIIEILRANGREVSAAKIRTKIRNAAKPSDEIRLYSLQEMASFLLKHKEYICPLVGTDPVGTIQVEWRFDGNGLLVIAFLGQGQVYCVALSDATDGRGEICKSIQLSTDEAVETFGDLIPKR
jgi:hypothetical protein